MPIPMPIPQYIVTPASGAAQTGVSGLLLREPLVVRVTDHHGQPVEDAIVSFAADAASPPVWLAAASMITDANGTASIAVRVAPNSVGMLTVTAQLEDRIGTIATFRIPIARPALVFARSSIPRNIQYGEVAVFDIQLNGDPDPAKSNYRVHPLLNLKATASGCDVVVRPSTQYAYGPGPAILNDGATLSVFVVGRALGTPQVPANARVTISLLEEDQSAVPPLVVPLLIVAPSGPQVTAQSGGQVTQTQPMLLALVPDSPPASVALVYRGVNFRVPATLRVKSGSTVLTDGATGYVSDQTAIADKDVKTAPLQIGFTGGDWDHPQPPQIFPDPAGGDPLVPPGTPYTLDITGSAITFAGVWDPAAYPAVFVPNSTPFTWGSGSGRFPFVRYSRLMFTFLVKDGTPVITPNRVPIEGSPCVLVTAGPNEDVGFRFRAPTVAVSGIGASDVLVSDDGRRLYFRLPASASPAAAGDAAVTITNADGTLLKGTLTYVDAIDDGLDGLAASLESAAKRADDYAQSKTMLGGGAGFYLDDLRASFAAYEQILDGLGARVDALATPRASELWQRHMSERAFRVKSIINGSGQRWSRIQPHQQPPNAQLDGQPCAAAGDVPTLIDPRNARLMAMTAAGSVIAGPSTEHSVQTVPITATVVPIKPVKPV